MPSFVVIPAATPFKVPTATHNKLGIIKVGTCKIRLTVIQRGYI